MKYQITNQRDLRRAFWAAYPDLSQRRKAKGCIDTDTRFAFNDYVEILSRDGFISEKLTYSVTLPERGKKSWK